MNRECNPEHLELADEDEEAGVERFTPFSKLSKTGPHVSTVAVPAKLPGRRQFNSRISERTYQKMLELLKVYSAEAGIALSQAQFLTILLNKTFQALKT